MNDACDAVLVDDPSEVEGIQQVAAEQSDLVHLHHIRQRGEIGCDIEQDGLLALLHEDARDLGTD